MADGVRRRVRRKFVCRSVVPTVDGFSAALSPITELDPPHTERELGILEGPTHKEYQDITPDGLLNLTTTVDDQFVVDKMYYLDLLPVF